MAEAGRARRTAAALGYNECVSYSFIDRVSAALFGAGYDGASLRLIADELRAGDVVIKSPNALDYCQGLVGYLIGAPTGGTGERGELYTLGRRYAAASMTIEVTPLFRFTPNLFVNLEDPSALAQWVVDYDWRQNLQLLAALNLPVGPTGTEYGGIETPVEGRYLATGAGVFIQLAAYF